MKKVELSAIAKMEITEGYIWMSDSKRPIILKDNSSFDFTKSYDNPFILEGGIKTASGDVFMLKYATELMVTHFSKEELEREENESGEDQLCYTQGVGDNKKIQLKEIWEEVSVEGDFPTLELQAVVFNGFKE